MVFRSDTEIQEEIASTPKVIKLYTKTGDKGKTSLYTGHKVAKNHTIIEVVGGLDELNAQIGMIFHKLTQEGSLKFKLVEYDNNTCLKLMENIMHILFDIGSHVSTPRLEESDPKKKTKKSLQAKYDNTMIDPNIVDMIESHIDVVQERTPPLKQFILPTGCELSCLCHIARAICRRVERSIVKLNAETYDNNVLVFINRLSDYLFAMARYVNFVTDTPELVH